MDTKTVNRTTSDDEISYFGEFGFLEPHRNIPKVVTKYEFFRSRIPIFNRINSYFAPFETTLDLSFTDEEVPLPSLERSESTQRGKTKTQEKDTPAFIVVPFVGVKLPNSL